MLYIIGGRLVWEMEQYLAEWYPSYQQKNTLAFFPAGVDVYFEGFKSLSIPEAESVLQNIRSSTAPPPTMIVCSLGAHELKQTGLGDIMPVCEDLLRLQQLVQEIFRKAATSPQCYLLGPSARPFWGFEKSGTSRKVIKKLYSNREKMMSELRKHGFPVIWPAGLQSKMKQCFLIKGNELPQENRLGAQILLRTLLRYLGVRKGWFANSEPAKEQYFEELDLDTMSHDPRYVRGGMVDNPRDVGICFKRKLPPPPAKQEERPVDRPTHSPSPRRDSSSSSSDSSSDSSSSESNSRSDTSDSSDSDYEPPVPRGRIMAPPSPPRSVSPIRGGRDKKGKRRKGCSRSPVRKVVYTDGSSSKGTPRPPRKERRQHKPHKKDKKAW